MEENTTNPVLTLFSVRADYVGCEYGSLFIVAANCEATARDLVLASLDRRTAVVESCHPIGTTDLFDEAQVVDEFAT